MADATITIDANTTQLVAKAKQAEGAFRKVGDGISDAGKKIEMAGKKSDESFGRAALSMGRAVVAARLAMAALNAVGTSVTTSLNTAATRAAARGGAKLRASQAASEAGLDQGIVSAFMTTADSAATSEQKASLVESIAKEGGVSKQRFLELASAANSGVFSDARLKEAVTSGESLDIAKESARLSPGALDEIATRKMINRIDAQPGRISGNVVRTAAAIGEANDRADPVKAALRDALPAIVSIKEKINNLDVADKQIKNEKQATQERIAAAVEKSAADAKKLNVNPEDRQ